MGIGESGFYPTPRARVPWTGLLTSWLVALVVFFGGMWLTIRYFDGQSSPDAGLAGGLVFFVLLILCSSVVIVSTVASVIVWLVRRAQRDRGIK